MEPINILVVGECGDGKSTLIEHMRDKDKSEAVVCGKNPRGVTKDILMYPCYDLDGQPLNFIDTPGVGDHDVTPIALLSMIEGFLTHGNVPGGIRGVVVTTPVPDARIKLGAQIVQAIVDKGFVAANGEDKYANIILCGTKVDKADDEEKRGFVEGLDGNESVRSLFFNQSPNQSGPCAMVCKEDYTPLIEAIRGLPANAIAFEQPDSRVMAQALAERLGMHPEAFEAEMHEMRQIVQEQSEQMKVLLQQMHEAQQEHRKETARKDSMIQEMMTKLEEDRRRQEEAQLARDRKLEEMRQEQNEANRRMRQEEAEARQRMVDALEQEQATQREQMEAMERERAEENERHRQAMLQMSNQCREAVQSAGSSRGRCFPGDAMVQAARRGKHVALVGPVAMRDLKVGDRVLVLDRHGRQTFDDIYFFGHASQDEVTEYVCLHTSKSTLRLSGRHFVAYSIVASSWSERKYIYAHEVKCGYYLWTLKDGEVCQEQVQAVTKCICQGVYNPYTLSGNIVVDEVVASAHSDWLLDDYFPQKYTGWLPAVYQAIMLPGRIVYRLMGSTAADILDVNNPQKNFKTEIGTSPVALAFLFAAFLMPMVLVLGLSQVQ